MKLVIEIPEEFEVHFDTDRFENSLERLREDANSLAGNYEKELANMLIKAFKKAKTLSKSTTDVDKIINEINKEQISKGRKLALYEIRPIIENLISNLEMDTETSKVNLKTETGFVLKNFRNDYFVGMNKYDSQLRKAKIYTSLKHAIESKNDVNTRFDRIYGGVMCDFDIVPVEIREIEGDTGND